MKGSKPFKDAMIRPSLSLISLSLQFTLSPGKRSLDSVTQRQENRGAFKIQKTQ
uniref:Uncharacterized protein n=1 Tax=Peronospora matthiolae TaxID=2874970 RepID=A0AAV1U7L8_9STRA